MWRPFPNVEQGHGGKEVGSHPHRPPEVLAQLFSLVPSNFHSCPGHKEWKGTARYPWVGAEEAFSLDVLHSHMGMGPKPKTLRHTNHPFLRAFMSSSSLIHPHPLTSSFSTGMEYIVCQMQQNIQCRVVLFHKYSLFKFYWEYILTKWHPRLYLVLQKWEVCGICDTYTFIPFHSVFHRLGHREENQRCESQLCFFVMVVLRIASRALHRPVRLSTTELHTPSSALVLL